jgi:hypothetical protein
MLPTCRQVAELASENIDEPVRGARWLKMKLHLLICTYCRRYGKQMVLSSKTVKALDHSCQPNETIRKKVEECFVELHCDHKDKKE